jgi:hypothetical protein
MQERGITARIPQCKREQRVCPNAREERAQCACTCIELVTCSTMGDNAGGVGLVQRVLASESEHVGEQHLLQHT